MAKPTVPDPEPMDYLFRAYIDLTYALTQFSAREFMSAAGMELRAAAVAYQAAYNRHAKNEKRTPVTHVPSNR